MSLVGITLRKIKPTTKIISRKLHKNLWIEEHTGYKEDVFSRFKWNRFTICSILGFGVLMPAGIFYGSTHKVLRIGKVKEE